VEIWLLEVQVVGLENLEAAWTCRPLASSGLQEESNVAAFDNDPKPFYRHENCLL